MRIQLRYVVCAVVAVASSSTSGAAQATPAATRAAIGELRAPAAPWRAIPWRTSLADGLLASRLQGKPVLLWIFIDRPIDDARC